MSVIQRYCDFKLSLGGFTEVPFAEFRKNVLPLRAKRVWDKEMVDYATALLEAGAGYALQGLCGARHPAAAQVLGPAELKADPMSKAELDDHMCALVRSCRAAGWGAETYIAFAAYLNSDAAQAPAAPPAPPGPAGPPAPPPINGEAAPEPHVKDRFAEMYRAASPAFKRATVAHLAIAAATA